MVVALFAVLGGMALMVVAGLAHRSAEDRMMAHFLSLTPQAPDEADHGDNDETRMVATRAVDLAGQVVQRMDRAGALAQALERAKIPLRPGEFVIILGGSALAIAAVLLVVTHSAAIAVAGVIAAALSGGQVLRRRAAKRKRAFEAQLPDALALVASSLSAGHTFLRAIQMMCEESGPPLSEEFARVVGETRLGDPVVDALERMAQRLRVRDMDMVVQAIRIQQTVGGRLADLLHTLGDFIRARDEVRREVKVLTAEGRMSAYVLAALVPFLFGVIQVLNPAYVQPLYHGWGLVLLAFCFGSVLIGMVVILRMVRIDI